MTTAILPNNFRDLPPHLSYYTLAAEQKRFYLDPNLNIQFKPAPIRESTIQMLQAYEFTDDAGKPIEWSYGQLEIIDCILNRSDPTGILRRIEILASTQYGKSLAVAAGVSIRASLKPGEKWAIVAGTDEKAKIIMEYVIMLSLNNDIIRAQLVPETSLDKLRMKRSADRLGFKRKGEVRVYSAGATQIKEVSKSLMGFGSPNVIEDEASLVPDKLQSTVLRMLGGHKDNFLVKIGNPFNRGHFLKTWMNGKYHRIFIDYIRALAEGRYTEDFIDEMKDEAMFDILYECKFPPADMIDASGWSLLLTEENVRSAFVDAEQPFGFFRLGGDIAGGGRNYSTLVLRAYNVASVIYRENVKDTMLYVGQVNRYANELGVRRGDIAVDKVGIGRGAYDRLIEQDEGVELKDEGHVIGVNAGVEAQDKEKFSNKRAEMYWRIREWILRGGKLERSEHWFELAKIRYKVDSSGRIQIMPKEMMLKVGVDSPDVADALSFTFYASEPVAKRVKDNTVQNEITMESIDPYAQHAQR